MPYKLLQPGVPKPHRGTREYSAGQGYLGMWGTRPATSVGDLRSEVSGVNFLRAFRARMDRRNRLPDDTFYPAVMGLAKGDQSAWAAFRVEGLGPVGSPVKYARNKGLMAEFGNRFNVILSYAVRVFVAWDSSLSADDQRGTLSEAC